MTASQITAISASLAATAEAAWAAYYANKTREGYQAAFRATYSADAEHARIFSGYCRP